MRAEPEAPQKLLVVNECFWKQIHTPSACGKFFYFQFNAQLQVFSGHKETEVKTIEKENSALG